MRYRALYVTLPFANGAILAASFVALYALIGTPESWIAILPGVHPSFVQFIHSMAWWLVGLIPAMIVICCVDLIALANIYGLNLRSLARVLWFGTPSERTIGIDLFMSALITLPWGSAVFIAVAHGIPVLPVPDIRDLSGFAASPAVAGLVLSRWYLHALIHCEERLSETR